MGFYFWAPSSSTCKLLVMEATLITHTDGTRSVQYGRQDLAIAHGIATYHCIELSEKTVKQIIEAHAEEVQSILQSL